MSITYAVIGKKTYEDLLSNQEKYVYEVPSVSENPTVADDESDKYKAFWGSKINLIDGEGRLKQVDSKVIPFEGLHKIDNVRKVIDIASKNESNMKVIMSKGRY